MRPDIPTNNRRLSIVITAGPTREKIDPVRFISNYSTGTFGYEIAREGLRRGHNVTLVSGPTCLETPKGVKFIRAESGAEMRKAVQNEFKRADCVIMAAAVSDWRPKKISKTKIKRRAAGLTLKLVQNPDILGGLGRRKGGRILAGFALETENLAQNALKKLKAKNLDLIVANILSQKQDVFGPKRLDVLIMDRFGAKASYRRKTKRELAKIVLDKAANFNI